MSAAGERDCVGVGMDVDCDALLAEVLVLLLVSCFFDPFTAGVRRLVDDTGTSWAGSAPVIVSSASLTSSGVFSPGILRLGRVDFDFVTNPSLSSLKVLTVSLEFMACMVVALAYCLRGAGLGFATRVADNATFALGGRGIVAYNHSDVAKAGGIELCPVTVVASGPRR